MRTDHVVAQDMPFEPPQFPVRQFQWTDGQMQAFISRAKQNRRNGMTIWTAQQQAAWDVNTGLTNS